MSNRARWIAVWLAAVLPLLGWWLTGLTDLDEGYYGAVVAEMNRRHEWITPYFNGSPWFEKPILLYWVAKPCVMVFGQDLGPRLPSVLATIALLGLVAWFCWRKLSEETAQLAVLVLAGSLLVVGIGRLMLTDALLNLFLTASLLLFWESLSNARLRWLSGLALGIAVLAKGPVAIIFFVAIVGWMGIRHKSIRGGLRGGWIGFSTGFVLAVGSWYVPAWLVNGQLFVQKFLIDQNVGRFTGGDSAHSIGGIQGLVFYLPILLLGMLPWSCWIPVAIKRRMELGELGALLSVWAILIFAFFSVSAAKLPHYLLPIMVPLAILIAHSLKPKAVWPAVSWCVALALIANVAQWEWDVRSGQREAHDWARYLREKADGADVALYQLTRRQVDQGTGTTQLQETSLPSMLFYLDRTAIDTDSLDQLIGDRREVWIFTRDGRIRPEDYAQVKLAGRELEELHPAGIRQEHYRLFRLR